MNNKLLPIGSVVTLEIVNFVGYVNAESQAFRIKYAEYLKENGLQED